MSAEVEEFLAAAAQLPPSRETADGVVVTLATAAGRQAALGALERRAEVEGLAHQYRERSP